MGSRHLDFKVYVLATELADSIGANVAEGFGRGAGADRRRMFLIARGSLTETEHWLDRAAQRGLLSNGRLHNTLAEVARLLNGLIRAERV